MCGHDVICCKPRTSSPHQALSFSLLAARKPYLPLQSPSLPRPCLPTHQSRCALESAVSLSKTEMENLKCCSKCSAYSPCPLSYKHVLQISHCNAISPHQSWSKHLPDADLMTCNSLPVLCWSACDPAPAWGRHKDHPYSGGLWGVEVIGKQCSSWGKVKETACRAVQRGAQATTWPQLAPTSAAVHFLHDCSPEVYSHQHNAQRSLVLWGLCPHDCWNPCHTVELLSMDLYYPSPLPLTGAVPSPCSHSSSQLRKPVLSKTDPGTMMTSTTTAGRTSLL